MGTDWGMVVGLSGLVSTVVLGALAIVLSVYFFNAAKNTESNVKVALGEIRQQVTSLEKITARQLDRLTKAVVEPKVNRDEVFLLKVVEAFSKTSGSQLVQPSPVQPMPPEAIDHILRLHIVAYLYAGVANWLLQSFVPQSMSELSPDTRRLVDLTHSDFQILDSILSNVERITLEKHPLFQLYAEAVSVWKPLVRDTLGVYASRSSTDGT
jgi:hypothetical protein